MLQSYKAIFQREGNFPEPEKLRLFRPETKQNF